MNSRSNAAPGRFGLLDVVVLIAMAVTATAFAAGLIINSGIDMMAGVIAGAALFIVMASSHYVITRQARSATVALMLLGCCRSSRLADVFCSD